MKFVHLCPDLLTQVYIKCIWERLGVHGIYSSKKPKIHFPPSIFPLHLKVKLCISKINLSHVSHFFPLTANCSEKASCHIKDFHKVIFIPNEKTTFSLNTQYLMSKTHTYGSSSHLVKYNNNLLSTDQF